MNYLIKLIILTLGGLITNIAISETLAIDAQERGINSTCLSYLGQIEESSGLNGLNITFAHPSDPFILHLFTFLLKIITMEALHFQQPYLQMEIIAIFQQ